VLGIPVPENVYYLTPPGMNLDNSWQAHIGGPPSSGSP
jgi:hypothetical protein